MKKHLTLYEKSNKLNRQYKYNSLFQVSFGVVIGSLLCAVLISITSNVYGNGLEVFSCICVTILAGIVYELTY